MSATEGVSVVLPVTAATAPAAADAVKCWLDALAQTRREYELILVDDSLPADAAQVLGLLAAGRPRVRVVRHDGPPGFGACLNAALPATAFPLVCTCGLDYPYTPGDVRVMLDRIAHVDPEFGLQTMLVSGCRTGRPVPPGWKWLGRAFRLFTRVAFGMPLDPLPGWLGFRTHARSWRAWAVFGSPLLDPDSAFQLVRKSALDRFPVQSRGGFVHTEVAAKLTFLTQFLDEIPLTPKPDAVPPTDWADAGTLFRGPKFHPPVTVESSAALEPAPVPIPADA